jgi:hypothetical protein
MNKFRAHKISLDFKTNFQVLAPASMRIELMFDVKSDLISFD